MKLTLKTLDNKDTEYYSINRIDEIYDIMIKFNRRYGVVDCKFLIDGIANIKTTAEIQEEKGLSALFG